MNSATARQAKNELDAEGKAFLGHVLIVDDEVATRRLLARALASLGYRTTDCGNAQEAMELLPECDCDVVVLDFEMPGLNGAQWCEKLRQRDDERAQLPVIMLTAYAGEREEIACLQAGANDFVTKPVSVAVLGARIATQFRLRAMNAELQAQKRALEDWRIERERDLEAAQLTQRALLPATLPKIAGWNGAAVYEPLIQVGGDVYGCEPAGDGTYLFWLVDATGHGAAAALLTTLAGTLFHQAAEAAGGDPVAVLNLVNQQLFEVFHGKQFMSASCLLIRPQSGEIIAALAGHPPTAFILADGTCAWSQEGGPLLGLLAAAEFPAEKITLQPGDAALLYTDGIHSAASANGGRRDHRVLGEILAPAPDARALLHQTLERLSATASDGRTDDLTAIVWMRAATANS